MKQKAVLEGWQGAEIDSDACRFYDETFLSACMWSSVSFFFLLENALLIDIYSTLFRLLMLTVTNHRQELNPVLWR